MRVHDKDMRGVAVAALVAVIGTITIFFIKFGPGNEIQSNRIGMITSAAVERAGATVVPSSPIKADQQKTSVASD
jgi:hypothetical protein